MKFLWSSSETSLGHPLPIVSPFCALMDEIDIAIAEVEARKAAAGTFLIAMKPDMPSFVPSKELTRFSVLVCVRSCQTGEEEA